VLFSREALLSNDFSAMLSVFSDVAVHAATTRNTTLCTAPHCNTLQHTATHCNTLHRTTTRYDAAMELVNSPISAFAVSTASVVLCVAVCCIVLQSVSQCVVLCCNMPQCGAVSSIQSNLCFRSEYCLCSTFNIA